MVYFETTIGSGFVFNSHTVILTGFNIMEGYATITIDGILGYIYSGQIKNIAGVNATLDYMDSNTGKAGMYLSETVTPITPGTTTTKAVQFSAAWADVMNDFELKAIAKVAILEMGDELASEPVRREGGFAYVLFTPSPIKYIEMNIVSGLGKSLTSIISWVAKNPGKAGTLLAVFGLTYWGISIVDWRTKVEEAKVAVSDAIKDGVNDILNSSIPEVDKVKLITLLLQKNFGTGKEGTDWGNIVMMLGALAIGAFLLKEVIGGRK